MTEEAPAWEPFVNAVPNKALSTNAREKPYTENAMNEKTRELTALFLKGARQNNPNLMRKMNSIAKPLQQQAREEQEMEEYQLALEEYKKELNAVDQNLEWDRLGNSYRYEYSGYAPIYQAPQHLVEKKKVAEQKVASVEKKISNITARRATKKAKNQKNLAEIAARNREINYNFRRNRRSKNRKTRKHRNQQMRGRLFIATFFFLILLGCVLYLAIQVTPAVIQLPELDVPPAPPVPLYGQLPAAQWGGTHKGFSPEGKYVRIWNGEYRVVAPIKGQPKLYMDSSGNVIYPDE